LIERSIESERDQGRYYMNSMIWRYNRRRKFIEKIVESVHYHGLTIYAYSRALPPMPLRYERMFTREINERTLVDEEHNECYNVSPQYEDTVSRDLLYFEFNVPIDFRHPTKRWHRVSVRRDSFLKFLERIGIRSESISAGDGRMPKIVAGQLILNDVDAAGRTIARRYAEVREPKVEQESRTPEPRADSPSLNTGPGR
jgi:hypothetical protein